MESARAPFYVFGVVAFLFVFGVCFRYHGYSIQMWEHFIGPSDAQFGVQIGTARGIRGDDWAHDIPYQLAQLAHVPPFPEVNSNIGLGLNVLVPNKVPCWHWVTFFRPSVWGYLGGASFGLSWMWLWQTLGLFYGFFLLAWIVSGGKWKLALGFGVLILFSPFFQFWSFHKAEIPTHGAFAMAGFWGMCTSRSSRAIVAWALLFAYSAVCFGLHIIYPGFQVSAFYVFATVSGGLLLSGEWKVPPENSRLRKLAVLASTFCALAIAWAFWRDIRTIIELIQSTQYPGRRLSLGGDRSIFVLPSSNYFVAAYLRRNFGILGNICESATALYLGPVVMMAVLRQWYHGRSPRPVMVGMALCLAIFLSFLFWGFSPAMAKLSGLGFMTSNRAPLALALLDFFALLFFLSPRVSPRFLSVRDRAGISFLWFFLLFLNGCALRMKVPGLNLLLLFFACCLNGLLAFLLLDLRRPSRFLTVYCGISIAYTIGFNPLSFGDTAGVFYENPLSKQILAVDKRFEGKTKWVTFADAERALVLANLPRVLGVHSLDGAHGYPQLALWKEFDPAGKYHSVYNQVAYVYFTPTGGRDVVFSSRTNGQVEVNISPSHPIFSKLGVTHFLSTGKASEALEKQAGLNKVYCGNEICIFENRELE